MYAGKLFEVIETHLPDVPAYTDDTQLYLSFNPDWIVFMMFRIVLRWLDTVFQDQYLPSLSINYVAKNKVLEQLPPQLYWVKMKICYDQVCNGIRVVIATK